MSLTRYYSSQRVKVFSHRLLPTHDKHSRQTYTPSAGFAPTIPTIECPQTYILDRAATGIDFVAVYPVLMKPSLNKIRTNKYFFTALFHHLWPCDSHSKFPNFIPCFKITAEKPQVFRFSERCFIFVTFELLA